MESMLELNEILKELKSNNPYRRMERSYKNLKNKHLYPYLIIPIEGWKDIA